jgi:hypothetical protein
MKVGSFRDPRLAASGTQNQGVAIRKDNSGSVRSRWRSGYLGHNTEVESRLLADGEPDG